MSRNTAWRLAVILLAGAMFAAGPATAAEEPDKVTGSAPQAAIAADVPLETLEALTIDWPGPYEGVPPLDLATPQAIEAAFHHAVGLQRSRIAAITASDDPPTFENTVAALEASRKPVDNIQAILRIFTGTASSEEIRGVAARVAALVPELEDEIAHDATLFARIAAVHDGLPDSAPTPAARRLVEVTYDDFLRRGAALSASDKARLRDINARLAAARTEYQNRQSARAAEPRFVFVDDPDELRGLGDAHIASARAVAEKQGRPDEWAFTVARHSSRPVLLHAESRALREQVWRLPLADTERGGPGDNSDVITEILKLRGEKAALLGYPSFAHYQTDARMIGTPEHAMDVMMRAWRAVHAHTLEEIETLATLAEADGIAGAMQPWDREYYREKRRQQEFELEMDDVEAYFEFENMVEAMFWSAGRVYDLAFEQVDGLPTVAPEVRVYEVRREGDLLGVLWVDLFRRDGKAGGSFASQYRSYEAYRGEEIVPLVALHSAAAPPEDGQPTLLPWERVNVIFHEFGHTLQTLSNTAPYPSLGPYALPWDFIEVPSLLHERWFRDRELLKRFALHYETGEAMPDSMLDRLEKALKYDRVFSVTLEYLAIAIVDMRLHMLADGREIDARAEERKILEEIGLPPSVAPMMPINNAVHPFTPVYAAGVYTYLWSDMLAADIATTFLGAPGGLYDEGVAARWRSEVLDIAFLLPPEAAFRNFRGRDPDIDALLRRFDLLD